MEENVYTPTIKSLTKNQELWTTDGIYYKFSQEENKTNTF